MTDDAACYRKRTLEYNGWNRADATWYMTHTLLYLM